jgi:hypothetical protein
MFSDLNFIPYQYPSPISPPESAYGSEVEAQSLQPRISAVLKRSLDFEVEELTSSSEGEEVNPSKKLRWDSMHSVRLLHERRGRTIRVPIDALVSDGRLTQFFQEENAYNQLKERHHSSTLTHSVNPEEVREIRACIRKPISKMKNKRLLKNYRRLCGKQTHIFRHRSDSFQETINQYLNKYKQAIKKRKLDKVASQMPTPIG